MKLRALSNRLENKPSAKDLNYIKELIKALSELSIEKNANRIRLLKLKYNL